MRKLILSAALVLSCGASAACTDLTTPDGDDIARLAEAIDAKDDADRNFLTNEKTTARARDWARQNLDEEVGKYECPGGYNRTFTRRDVLETLNQARWYGYRLEEILKDIGPNSGCKITWHAGAKESLNEHVANAREDEDESTDSAYWLPTIDGAFLKEHKELSVIVGVMVVGGVIVALPAAGGIGRFLCPLSDAVLCPDDPGAPGVPQTGPGDEGDR